MPKIRPPEEQMTERTMIYMTKGMKEALMRLCNEESLKQGSRYGMAEVIRLALIDYLKKEGYDPETGKKKGGK